MSKPCRNNCGTDLTWKVQSDGTGFYAGPDGSRHKCPNWNKPPQQKPPANNTPLGQTGAPITKKSDNYYEGVRKVYEFNMIDANGQLLDPKWHILKIVEQQVPIPNSPSTQTVIVYILGFRE